MDRYVKSTTIPIVEVPIAPVIEEPIESIIEVEKDDLRDNIHLTDNQEVNEMDEKIVNDAEKINDNLDMCGEELEDLFDLENWEDNLSQRNIDLLVEKGPIRVMEEDVSVYLVNDNGRSFNFKHFNRYLPNGEKLDRS
ncbi:hypothetical protein C2S53_001564 [Perilla frutescens var. hirtella]|uniref:Uncharacterized protein n=1 Tax=Perilla frutescens var. hirtella TaxID=608512 RepID=A0AAD4J2S3_PERFH|nr:hypothetical protein C2S53_001564 [Perilla frutescens var. hirtella]